MFSNLNSTTDYRGVLTKINTNSSNIIDKKPQNYLVNIDVFAIIIKSINFCNDFCQKNILIKRSSSYKF